MGRLTPHFLHSQNLDVKHLKKKFDMPHKKCYTYTIPGRRKEVKAMGKVWSIGSKDFINREEAKKFLATAWKENPAEYLDGYDIINDFEEYLANNNKIDLHTWLLELLVYKNEAPVNKGLEELRQFISTFIDKVVDDDIDNWLIN